MEERIKLLIVDDNAQLGEKLKRYFNTKADVEVVGVAGSTSEAVQLIKKTRPDALITDMILPKSDGLSLLERLNSSEFDKKPKTIVVSAAQSEKMVQAACSLGAKYYMIKPCDKEILYHRLQDMFELNRETKRAPKSATTKTLDEQITAVFLTVGIPANIKGYQFLRKAIKMSVNNPELINYMTKRLYPGIAAHFDTSASKVERAIRHAIEVAWSRGKIENINKFIGYDIYTGNDKPTNGEFIALMADKLLLERGVA